MFIFLNVHLKFSVNLNFFLIFSFNNKLGYGFPIFYENKSFIFELIIVSSFFMKKFVDFSIIDIIKFLNPLRIVIKFKSLNSTLLSLLSTLPLLTDAFIIFFMYLIMNSISGLQIFRGC